jgi:hypothetical protein
MPSVSPAEESLPLEELEAREQDVNSGAPHFNIKTRGLPKLPSQDVNTKEKGVTTTAQQHGRTQKQQNHSATPGSTASGTGRNMRKRAKMLTYFSDG